MNEQKSERAAGTSAPACLATITFRNGSRITFAKCKGPAIRGLSTSLIIDPPNAQADRPAKAGGRLRS